MEIEKSIYYVFDKQLYRQGSPVYSGDGSPLSDISTIQPSSIGDGFSPGNTEMVQGNLQSGSFLTGVRGWQIDAEGNAEFNDGTFRGTFSIGGTIITISDIANLQTTINMLQTLGGGTVALTPDTYLATSSFTVPSNVTIEGNGATIDFQGGAFQFLIQGSNAYSTGTVVTSNDSTTVIGTGTTWVVAMQGRSILLGEQWYEILTVNSTTSITLGSAYIGTNQVNDTYVIATTVDNIKVRNLTVQNSSVALVKFRYVNTLSFDGFNAISGLIGFDGDDSAYAGMVNFFVDSCGTGITLDNVMFGTYFNFNLFSCSTNGMVLNRVWDSGFEIFSFINNSGDSISLTNCLNSGFEDFGINQATGNGIKFVSGCSYISFSDGTITNSSADGINITSTNKCQFVMIDIYNSAGQGIELVSGNNDIVISSGTIDTNNSDGIKLTASSDRISIIGCSIINNGNYGVNIAASTCDNNQIISPAFSNNSSGNINDVGVGTVVFPLIYTSIVPQPDFFCTSSSSGAMPNGVNTTGYFGRVVFPYAIQASKFSLDCQAVTVSGTADIALFSEDGQKQIFSFTTPSITTTGIKTISFTSTFIPAGTYYIAVNTNTTANLIFMSFKAPTAAGLLNIASEPVFSGTKTITASTMPATFDPTSLTYSEDGTMMFRLDN